MRSEITPTAHISGSGGHARARATRRFHRYARATLPYAVLLLCAVALLLLFVGCETVPDSVDEDITSPELFRLAQDAYNFEQYGTSLYYYNVILERFGTQRSVRVAAEYEIAYIHFKRGEDEMAKNMFAQLLAEYQLNNAGFPRWIFVLSTRIYEQLTGSEEPI